MEVKTETNFFVDISTQLVQTMKLSMLELPEDAKIGTFCLPSEQMHRLGDFGGILSVCTEEAPDCSDYMAKVVRWTHQDRSEADLEEENFRLECGLYNFAAENSFGPKVECCVICKNEDSSKYAGLIVLQRLQRTMDYLQMTGRLTDDQCKSAFDAVKKMHAAGIWHSDLQASNIMFNKKGKAFIIGFGQAWPFLQTPIPSVLRMVDYVRFTYSKVYDFMDNGRKFKTKHDNLKAFKYLVDNFIHLFNQNEDMNLLLLHSRNMTIVNYVKTEGCPDHSDPSVDSFKMYSIAVNSISLETIKRFGILLLQMRTEDLRRDKGEWEDLYNGLLNQMNVRRGWPSVLKA
jgi:hypothetical protein